MGYLCGLCLLQHIAWPGESLGYLLSRYGGELYALGAAQYGLDNLFGLVGYQYEECLGRGFLKQLEHFVGAGDVHFLGEPDDYYLIAALTGGELQFLRYGVALVGVYHCLLVPCIERVEPFVVAEIVAGEQELAPAGYLIVADGFPAGGFAAVYYGEGEVEVGVDEFAHLGAGGAMAAGVVSLGAVVAEQVVGEGKGGLHFAGALGAAEEQGMGHGAFAGIGQQPLYYGLLRYYISEVHISYIATGSLRS